MKKLILFFLIQTPLFLAGISDVLAQGNAGTMKVGGKITDEKNAPAEFSTIRLLRAKDSSLVKTAITNTDGVYTFERTAPGTYVVAASAVGYKNSFSKPVTVSDKDVTVDPMSLVPAVKNLKEVSLTTQKPMIERKMDRLVLNVESTSLSAGSTAMEVLEKAPGVIVDKDDNISMKGKQGVLIQIDGKQTYMSSADVANMLRNMQSSQIESIELITSPSAKYDAAGASGIINIRTKKNKSYGVNGSVTAGTGYGKTSKYNGGGTLNYRGGKLNLFGNYNYGNNRNKNNLDLYREVSYVDTLTNFSQINRMFRTRHSNSYKAGADYFISKNHTLGILLNGYANNAEETANNHTSWLNNFAQGELISIDGNSKEKYSNNALNLNYKGTFKKGREFSADADYSDYNGKQDELRGNNYTGTNIASRTPLNVKNYAPSNITVKSVKADYSSPLKKDAKLEMGLKASMVTTDNDLLLARQAGTVWVPDADYTNHFIYDEDIYAGYLNFMKEGKTNGIQFGLRAEQTHSKGNSVTRSEVVERNYLKLFPSISLSHKAGKDHQFGLSYSRRIDRPSYDELNPFLQFLDEYTFQKGNPFLNPQFTSSFDLSHTYKGTFNTSIGYSHTTNMMATVTEQDDATKKTYAIQRNLDNQDIWSLNVYAPFTPGKWWRMNNNLQVFNAHYTSRSDGGSLNAGQTAVTFNSDNTFTLSKTASFDASAQYQSPMMWGIFKMKSQLVFNAGFRKTFLSNRASVRVNVSDISNQRKSRISTTYQNMNLHFTEAGENRVARVSLSYRFGRNEIKGARNRQTGVSDEAGRMKN